jgi:hypothetical protein
MAEAVARAIGRPHHLMVEAGTGVGKSFAFRLFWPPPLPRISASFSRKPSWATGEPCSMKRATDL